MRGGRRTAIISVPQVFAMPLEATWSGPLSSADAVPLLRAPRVPRDSRRRSETAWTKALRLAQAVARLWRRGERGRLPRRVGPCAGRHRALLAQPCTADDLDIAVRYQPAGPEAQIGGDWYDAFVDASGAKPGTHHRAC
jgi:hypothetical protein